MFWKDDIQRLKASYRTLGAARFWPLILGTLAYILGGAWLAMTTVWPPSNCDHEGGGLAGWAKMLGCSPELLGGSAKQITLFGWLWFMPVTVVLVVAWSWIKHYNSRNQRNISE